MQRLFTDAGGSAGYLAGLPHSESASAILLVSVSVSPTLI
jgi:hypothetical protein